MNDKNINSSDASTGQAMVARVLARKAELEALLASTPGESSRTQNDIVTALNTVNAMLSGDLAAVPHVVVADMNRWLENNKHLAETSAPTTNAAPDAAHETAPDAAVAENAPVNPPISIATGLPMAEAWSPNS